MTLYMQLTDAHVVCPDRRAILTMLIVGRTKQLNAQKTGVIGVRTEEDSQFGIFVATAQCHIAQKNTPCTNMLHFIIQTRKASL